MQRGLVVVALVVGLLGGCSDGDDDDGGERAAPVDAATVVETPGVAVTPVPSGSGTAQSGAGDSLPAGWVEKERLLSGAALAYDGTPTAAARPTRSRTPFTTRVLVRYPADPADFSGRVVVEPFNTSVGIDLDVVWRQVRTLLEDRGDAWVGVTTRTSSATRLRELDPERYRSLELAANDHGWDVLRQVGALLKGPDGPRLLPRRAVRAVYMAGFSQSGIDTATFAGALNPVTRRADGQAVYDGYLPAAHAGSLSPLRSGDAALPTFVSEPMGAVDVPVVDVETQSDVEGFVAPIDSTRTYTNPGHAGVRRADATRDGDRYRLYELPGAPHAPLIPGCDGGGSSFPVDAFVRAALARLTRWAERGQAPPPAARIELSTTGVVSAAAVDVHGNARGGMRSPFVDVPLVRYEAHSTPGALCALAGRETPLPVDELRRRYDDVDGHMSAFTTALDDAIDDGRLLALDRAAILAAQRSRAEELFARPS